IPRKAKVRGKIFMIRIIGAADVIQSGLNQSDVGIEISQQVVVFLYDGIEFVAKPEVDGQSFRDPPVVLHEKAISPIVNLPPGVASLHLRLEGCAGEKILQRRSVEHVRGILWIRRIGAQECDAAPGIAERSAAESIAMQISSKLNGVLAADVGNMVDELSNRVRALEFWPLESSQTREEISAEAAAGQATGKWTADACVKTISRGWGIQIARQRRLGKPVVAESSFIDPGRIRSPNPVPSHYLGAGVNLGAPVGLELGEIFNRS